MVHLYLNTYVDCCWCHMKCTHAYVCFSLFCVSSGHAFKKGWSLDGFVFPSTCLLSLIIHEMRQRNELGSLERKGELQQNLYLDME